jgi:hypothetical protein
LADAFVISVFFDSVGMLSTIRSLEFLSPLGTFHQKQSLWNIDIPHGHYAVLIFVFLSCGFSFLIQCLGGPLPLNMNTVTKVPILHLGHLRCKISGGSCFVGGRPISAMSSGNTIFFFVLL